MSKDERDKFASKYQYKPEHSYIGEYEKHAKERSVKYTAPKGTARRASKRKRRMNIRLAALIMAAAVGIGGITLANNKKQNEETLNTITQMQEEGISPESRGLSTETIALFEKYDKYFEKFDSKKRNTLTDNDIIDMIEEVKGMHFSTVKEKVGALIGEDAKNMTMDYGTDSDGIYWESVIANKNSYEKVVYSSNNKFIFGIGNKNHIPRELAEVIRQLSSLEQLKTRLIEDKISKINAIRELQKLYEKLEDIATGEFIQDEKGNISIIHYEAEKENNRNEKERE